MHAETLNRLKRDNQFRAEQAIAIAETIDMAIAGEHLVTVPILDALSARVDGRFDAVYARFDAIDLRFDAINLRFDAIDSQFDAINSRFVAVGYRFESVQSRFDSLEAKIDSLQTKFASLRFQLIAITVAGTLGSPLVPKIGEALMAVIHGAL